MVDIDIGRRVTELYSIMQVVTTVDRGWSWVVLGVVYFSNIIACVVYMCGIFAIHFSATFNQPMSIVSINGGLAIGTFCFSGKFVKYFWHALYILN